MKRDDPAADVVCSVADALRSGDEVIINDRERALTVLGRDEDPSYGLLSGSDYPYRVVWLRGNGTEYRLRYSHTGRYFPRLNTDSELVTEESFAPAVGRPVKQTRATAIGERTRRIAVAGVESDRLTEWAMMRNLDRRAASTDGDRDE